LDSLLPPGESESKRTHKVFLGRSLDKSQMHSISFAIIAVQGACESRLGNNAELSIKTQSPNRIEKQKEDLNHFCLERSGAEARERRMKM
jgi:hypothetical protein